MATSHKYHNIETRWTYGAELELVDWPNRESLLSGMAIDENERANVNSNGVAVDGRGKLYHFGGEVLTAPSTEPIGPAEQLAWVKNRWPQATVNFRTGVNIHIRVPGLRDDLKKLKRLQTVIHHIMPKVLPIIDPILPPTLKDFPNKDALAGARRDDLRCRRNHHSFLPTWRVALQMKARTPKEFFEAEAIHLPTGKVHWAICLRACVNLRQLMQTDTVEFRHFPGSDSPEEVLNATLWCKTFLEAAFDGGAISAPELLAAAGPRTVGAMKLDRHWPKFSPYIHWMDLGYFYTTRYGRTESAARENIKKWLERPERDKCPQ